MIKIVVEQYFYCFCFNESRCLLFERNAETQQMIVMQEASDALSKTADSDTVSTYQVETMSLSTANDVSDIISNALYCSGLLLNDFVLYVTNIKWIKQFIL